MAEPFEVNDETWQELVLDSDTPVMVDFWAEWCGPCKMIAPAVHDMAAGALIVVGAGRLHSVWRRLKHGHHLGGDVLAVDFDHLRNHFLSGDPTGHEHVMSVKFGHGLTQPSPRCKRKGYSVSLLGDALGYLHKLVNTIVQGG